MAQLAVGCLVLGQEANRVPWTLAPHAPHQKYETPLAEAPASVSEEAGLRTVVCGLEAKVMALQEQMSDPTLQLLRERSERYERRLSSLEALFSQGAPPLPVKAEEVLVVASQSERPFQRSLQPGELRARARVIPRVEMGAAGSYVLICPHEGELAFATDSLEWFEWFCSLSSFRFIGHSGRFTAYREGQRSWRAYRTFHGQNYKQSLGTTDRLTVARLEEVAGMLQARPI